MKISRRFFTVGLGGLAAAPAIPLGAAAQVAPTAAMTNHLQVAKIIARAHNRCSKDFLMRHLRVDASVAGQVERLLLERGIITLPGANGVARAVNPIQPKLPQSVTSTVKDAPKSFSDRMEKRLEKVKRLAADESNDPEDHEDQAEDTIPTSHADTE